MLKHLQGQLVKSSSLTKRNREVYTSGVLEPASSGKWILFSGMLVALNQPLWESLHQGNWQTLQTSVFAPKELVNIYLNIIVCVCMHMYICIYIIYVCNTYICNCVHIM